MKMKSKAVLKLTSKEILGKLVSFTVTISSFIDFIAQNNMNNSQNHFIYTLTEEVKENGLK